MVVAGEGIGAGDANVCCCCCCCAFEALVRVTAFDVGAHEVAADEATAKTGLHPYQYERN
jgi:hypothetical protein